MKKPDKKLTTDKKFEIVISRFYKLSDKLDDSINSINEIVEQIGQRFILNEQTQLRSIEAINQNAGVLKSILNYEEVESETEDIDLERNGDINISIN